MSKDGRRNASLRISKHNSEVSHSHRFENSQNSKAIDYEVVNTEKLSNIYDNMSLLQKNNVKNNNEFMEILPENIKHKLKQQENILKLSLQEQNQNKDICKYLSKKLNKSEIDLLVNSQEDYITKNSINQFKENRKNLEEKYGTRSWIAKLRHSPKYKAKDKNYINLGSDNSPVWQSIKHNSSKFNNYYLSPLSNKNQFTIKESKVNLTKRIYNLDTNINVSNFFIFKNNFKIVGEDLIKAEKEQLNNLVGKKILYKKDFIDNLKNKNRNFKYNGIIEEQLFKSNY